MNEAPQNVDGDSEALDMLRTLLTQDRDYRDLAKVIKALPDGLKTVQQPLIEVLQRLALAEEARAASARAEAAAQEKALIQWKRTATILAAILTLLTAAFGGAAITDRGQERVHPVTREAAK